MKISQIINKGKRKCRKWVADYKYPTKLNAIELVIEIRYKHFMAWQKSKKEIIGAVK